MGEELLKKPDLFVETLEKRLEGIQTLAVENGSRAVRKEQDASDLAKDLVFEILEEYTAGKIEGVDAVGAMRRLADHAVRTFYVAGSEIMWPNILQSATQIAIAENAKKTT